MRYHPPCDDGFVDVCPCCRCRCLLQPCTSFTSSGSERSGDKRQRFQQMRKQHYNMRDAMLKVRIGLLSFLR
jgi:hypothetical protein